MTDSAMPTAPYALGRDEGDHLHFLNHLATVKVRPGETGSMTAVEFVAPRGFGPPLHRHDVEDELMVILDGEIAFRSGDTEFTATAGATVFLPKGIAHTFQVLSATARISTITAASHGRPRFDRMVDTLGQSTPEATLPDPTEIDPGHVAAVCGANGIAVLGPPPSPLD